MGLFKRSNHWHYDFWFNKTRFQGSTRLTNHEKAKVWLNAFKTNLAMGMVGLTNREPPPILSVFLKGTFLDFVRQNITKPRTIKFYEQAVTRLCAYQPFTMLRLDRIDELAIQGYKDFRLAKVVSTKRRKPVTAAMDTPAVNPMRPQQMSAGAKHLSPSTINGELRTLRKAMIYADRCDLVRYRKARYSIPGERNRTFILDGDLETRYLAACDYPLKQVAILMLDLGLRPEEAVSLRKADVTEEGVTVKEGKTANARRSLPQTQRTREVFKLCNALFPESEWVFPGRKTRHYTRGALDNLHAKVAADNGLPDELIPYSCRHTFGSRLAESGASVFEIKTAMGHSSVKTSEKYIHPTSAGISLAMKRKEMMDRLLRGETGELTAEVPTVPKKD